MPNLKSLALAAVLAAATAPMARADDAYYRQVAQQVCMSDVLTLCAAYVPDESSIMACMAQRRRDLSASCRKAFDTGMRARRANR